MFCGVIASWKLECKWKRLLWRKNWYPKLFRLLWKFLNIIDYLRFNFKAQDLVMRLSHNLIVTWFLKQWSVTVTDRSCHNQLVTTELVVRCRKSQLLLTGRNNLENVKCVHIIKCVKVRALFEENKVASLYGAENLSYFLREGIT